MEFVSGDSVLIDAKFILNFNVFSGANAQIVPLS